MDKGYTYPKNGHINVIWGVIWPLLLWFGIQILISLIFLMINDSNSLTNDIMVINVISQIISVIIFLKIYSKHEKHIVQVETNKQNIGLYVRVGLVILNIGIISGSITVLLGKIFNVVDTEIEMVNNVFNSSGFLIGVLSTVVLAPIFEEILFRGIIFNRINSKWNTWVAIMLSALIFGLIHGNFTQVVNATIIGIVLGFFYNKYHNLLPCILGHLFNNLLAFSCQQINFLNNGTYTIDCTLTIIIQILILVLSCGYFIFYYKKKNKILLT